MTEEIKQEHECFCKSKGFRKFLVVALGTFVGAFCALSLFAALHKPPMMMPPHQGPQMHHGAQFGGHPGQPGQFGERPGHKQGIEKKDFQPKKDIKNFAKEVKQEIKD